ncbi:MAG: diguanylate cyclase [bacterium]
MTENQTADWPVIPEVTIQEEIGRGAHSVVYRATRGGRSFAVKVQKPGATDPSGRSALRFRREGAILACLRHPGLPAILDLGEVNGRPYIVRELVRGSTLSTLLSKGPLPEDEILALARRLSGALAEVHRAGMVHCDVKPDNILVDDRDGARLIDFGFAVRATADHERGELAGTLLYSAPEQTGMLKRPLDGRADLYALGAVLYECATGAPPFEEADTGELLRRHAVTPPRDIRELNEDLSPALAALIHKLLAKDPDDRYQSRDGLHGDLDRLDVLNEIAAAGEQLVLGANDDPTDTLIDAALIGRNGELEALQRNWERAARGRGAVVIVEGEAGLGKSRLVRELIARVRSAGRLALVGRCSSAAPLPFAPLRGLVAQMLNRRLRLTPEKRRAAEERLRVAAGDAAPLLARFDTRLAAVLGDVSEMPQLGEVEDQFYDALADFLLRFSEQHRGLLLVFEDVHWLDDASRQVLTRLASRMTESSLLVVVTTTPQPADTSTAGADTFVENVGSALALRMVLEPLRDHFVHRIVASQLGEADAELGFARRIALRSNGSPFAATEYVRSMLDAGLLQPSWGSWKVDEQGLEKLDLPTDVIELVVRRLDVLDEGAREVLRAAAVLGDSFDVELLLKVCRSPDTAVHAAVSEAVRARVVEARGAGAYGFVHHDVRETLIASMEPTETRMLHQRIADALDTAPQDSSEYVYALARHYALGTVERNMRRVYETNVRAGQRALAEHAHEDAYSYLQLAESYAGPAGADQVGELSEALGEICARTGRLAEAIRYFEATLAATEPPLARATLRARLAHTHVANFHTAHAWEEVRAGLQELGLPFPRWLPVQLLSTAWCWFRGLLSDRLGRRTALTGEKLQKWTICAKLYEHGALAAYFSSRPLRLLMMVLRSLFASTRIGRSPALVASYYQHAVAFAVAGLHRRAMRNIDKAEQLAAALGDRLVMARSALYHGFVLHLCGDSVRAELQMARALEQNGKWIDSLHYLDGSGDLVFNLLLRGYCREAWAWIERQLPRMWFTSGGERARQGNPWAGSVLAILGRTNEGFDQQRQLREFVEGAPRSETFMWGEHYAYAVLFALEQGDHGPAVDEAIAAHRTLGLGPLRTNFHMRGFYVYQAYARMEQAMASSPAGRRPHLKRLKEAVCELRRASMIPSMDAHALAIEGAWRRLQRKFRRARRLLDRADRLARDIDSPWVRFEVARQRAHLLAEMGNRPASLREARFAASVASEHHWPGRGRRLRTEFDVRETMTGSLSSSPRSSRIRTSSAGGLQLQRKLDALLQVSLAAANVLDPDEQARIALDEIVRILGAERAFLFRCADEEAPLEFQVGRDADGKELKRPEEYSTSVVRRVQARCEPVVLSGAEGEQVPVSESVVTHQLRSIVAAPLMVREQIIGVVYLDNRLVRGVFTEDDVEILIALGNHIAIALETARAAQLEIRVEAEAQRSRLAENMRELSHGLSSTLDLQEVLARLLTGVTNALESDRAVVYLLEEQDLVRFVTAGRIEERSLRFRLETDSLLSWVVEERKPVVVRDARRDARIVKHGQEEPLTSWIGVPLISKDRVAGVLVLENDRQSAYSDNEAEIAFAFAGQAGIAIENARLFAEVQRLAITDELTGLMNRRQFFSLAEREFSRARRYGYPLSVVMVDVDHFKQVNDTHGHQVGDEVLAEIARRLAGALRDVDVLGRYGGEEFAVVLPDTGTKDAPIGLAERLRRCVADEPIVTGAGAISKTVSLGVAQLRTQDKDLTKLLARADAALYEAKEAGRNRAVFAD